MNYNPEFMWQQQNFVVCLAMIFSIQVVLRFNLEIPLRVLGRRLCISNDSILELELEGLWHSYPTAIWSYRLHVCDTTTEVETSRLFCTRCGDNAANGDETPHITTSLWTCAFPPCPRATIKPRPLVLGTAILSLAGRPMGNLGGMSLVGVSTWCPAGGNYRVFFFSLHHQHWTNYRTRR